MSEAADALGMLPIVQWKGKPCFIAPMDQVEVVAAYESYLEKQAWLTIERAKAKKWLSLESYEEQADGIRRDIVAGVYAYGSRAWAQSLRCLPHQKQLIYLMLTYPEGQRDLPMSVVDEMYADSQTLAELLRVAFKGSDPNGPAPAPHDAASG